MNPSEVKYIVVHASATAPDQDIGRKEIDRWHRQQGWLGIGYHFVVRRRGGIETGRPQTQAGAHEPKVNRFSLGICMIGGVNAKGKPENNFTPAQFDALATLIKALRSVEYQKTEVCGHRDFSPDLNGDGRITPNEFKKACPCFDVREWWAAQ